MRFYPVKENISKCYTACEYSASNAFATEAADKVGRGTRILLRLSLCVCTVEGGDYLEELHVNRVT